MMGHYLTRRRFLNNAIAAGIASGFHFKNLYAQSALTNRLKKQVYCAIAASSIAKLPHFEFVGAHYSLIQALLPDSDAPTLDNFWKHLFARKPNARIPSIIGSGKDRSPRGTVNGRSFDGIVNGSAAITAEIWSVITTGLGGDGGENIPFVRETAYLHHAMEVVLARNPEAVLNERLMSVIKASPQASIEILLEKLPPSAQDMTKNIFKKIHSQQYKGAIYAQVAEYLPNAMAEAHRSFTDLEVQIRSSRESLLQWPRTSQAALDSLNIYGRLATFVLADLAGDKQTAAFISNGIAAAKILFRAHTLVGSGGLGLIAGAGSAMGALNGLQEVGGGQNEVSKAMFSQLSAQVDQLRIEMNARFDRVEGLQYQTLTMLADIQRELQQTRIEISSKLDTLNLQLTEVHRAVRDNDRDRYLSEFQRNVLDPMRLLLGRPKSRWSIDEIEDLLSLALDHATETASLSVFRSNDTINSPSRADLMLDDFPSLSLPMRASKSVPVNPVEWARGVSAFVEFRTAVGPVSNPALRDQYDKALVIGQKLRSKYLYLCSDVNAQAAMKVYQLASSALLDNLLLSLDDLASRLYNQAMAPDNDIPFKRELKVGREQSTGTDFGDEFEYDARQLPRKDSTLFLTYRHPNGFSKWRLREGPVNPIMQMGGIWKSRKTGDGRFYGYGVPAPAYYTEHQLTGRGLKKPLIFRLAYLPNNGGPIPVYEFEELPEVFRLAREARDDSSELERWANELVENSITKHYDRVAAETATLHSFIVWHLCGVIDDPRNTPIGATMYRNFAEVKQALISLCRGYLGGDAQLFDRAAVTAEHTQVVHPWVKEGVFSYTELARKLLSARVEAATKVSMQLVKLSSGAKDPGFGYRTRHSIQLIDNNLAKLNNFGDGAL